MVKEHIFELDVNDNCYFKFERDGKGYTASVIFASGCFDVGYDEYEDHEVCTLTCIDYKVNVIDDETYEVVDIKLTDEEKLKVVELIKKELYKKAKEQVDPSDYLPF